MKKKLLALVLVLVFFISAGNTSAFAYAFSGTSTSKSDDVRYFDMTAAEYIDRFNAKYGSMGLTLLTDPSHDNCWLAINGDRTDIRVQFSDKVNGPVTTGSGLDMQEWNWLYAYITTSDYTVDVQYFASLPMLCSQLASVLGCEFTQEEFIDHCTTYGADYPRMQYTKGGVENEIRFRDSSIMDYHQTVYSVSIQLLQDGREENTNPPAEKETYSSNSFVEAEKSAPNQISVPASVPEPLRIIDIVARTGLTAVLYSDGTIKAVGRTEQYSLDDWEALAASPNTTFRFRSDGTMGSLGQNLRSNVFPAYDDIIAEAQAGGHAVGLRSNGTVVATGNNIRGEGDVSDWTDIIAVSAYSDWWDGHTVGLKSDGTVVATGDNYYGQCNVSGWHDVVQIIAIAKQTYGLCKDGTVVATGDNSHGECDVSNWTDIVQISVASGYGGAGHIVGLKKDGTILAAGSNRFHETAVSDWTNIVKVVTAGFHTVGLRDDGTVVATGENNFGQCDVDTLNAPVLAARRKTLEAVSSESVAQPDLPYTTPSGDFNYAILQNEPGYIYDKFDDYWTWYAAYDEAYTDANLLIGIQLEGEVGGSDLAGATLYTKIRNKDNRVIDGVQSMAFLVDGVKYSFPEMPGEDCAMAGSVVLYKNGYDLIKAFANAKEVSVKLKLFSGGTVLLDLDRTQFDRTLGNMCRKIIQYKVWEYYIENPGVEMLEMMFPMEVVRK